MPLGPCGECVSWMRAAVPATPRRLCSGIFPMQPFPLSTAIRTWWRRPVAACRELKSGKRTWNDGAPPGPVDLIFSNAVFHWVPDHLPVLSRLSDRLTPGGALALQMPDNLGEPTHLLMEETARHGPWSPLFASGLPQRHPLPTPAAYMETLGAAGLDVTLWRTTYYHQLPDADAIVDFVGGAGLRPWIAHVERKGGAAMADAYKQAYRKAVEAAYPPMADGSVLMAMPRLFLVARKRTATGESPAEAGL